jgi:hypothetical protein
MRVDVLRSDWVLVVMDQFTRRLVGDRAKARQQRIVSVAKSFFVWGTMSRSD